MPRTETRFPVMRGVRLSPPLDAHLEREAEQRGLKPSQVLRELVRESALRELGVDDNLSAARAA